ncbi:MAG: adenylate/guanylate cyclase domain-containing protein [Alphaproteobacteria bacterium]|nr:adenylate/guanylate cyclase domain-containing protein [Alphaproteobacteria bacterium]
MGDRHPQTEAVCAWLIGEARLIANDADYLNAFGERLVAAGLPIERVSTGVPTLHPQLDFVSGLWERGKGTQGRTYRRTPDTVAVFENSPLFIVYTEARTVRCRLETPPRDGEFTILPDLRAAGLTDYVAIPLPFSDGSTKAVSYATDRPGGFDDVEIALLEAIGPYVAALEEAIYMRRVTGILLDTYVGRVAGRRVLDGAIKRGMQENIRAAIWFSDLKGFTALSEIVPGPRLIDLLNDYFDIVTAAIETEGGEVLKFIGDAVMAIFQPDGDDSEAAHRALAAARSAAAALADRNVVRKAEARPLIGFGIALHVGDVLYGNVGGESRLDFTVIGPAVNLASRIEGLTRELDRTVLVSAQFAALHGGEFEPLGEFAFKGIAEKRAVYASLA